MHRELRSLAGLIILALVGSMAAASAQSREKAPSKANCPADAAAASYRIWPTGELYNRSGITGTHPCGRQMRCQGGVQMQGLQRQCRWL